MAVLAECPVCHRKQATKNKKCKCGLDLNAAKKQKERVRYWIVTTLPGGKQKKEYVGYSVQEARDAEGKRRGQKRETNGKFFDMMVGLDTTFNDLAQWYLGLPRVKRLASYKGIAYTLGLFNKEYGEKLVHDLTPEDLEAYQEKRREAGISPAMRDKDMVILKTMLNRAMNSDQIGEAPLKAFRGTQRQCKRGENARERVVTVSEYLRLLETASPHMRDMLVLGYNTGMRRGEIQKLEWSHVDREAGFLRLPATITKEKKKRDVPMNHHVEKVLAELPRALHDNRVITFRGNVVDNGKKAFKRACERAGIVHGMKVEGGLRFHDIRGTFKTRCLEAGIDAAVRDRLVGHTLPGMDAYYLRIKDEHLREATDTFTQRLDEDIEEALAQNIAQNDLSY